MCIKTEKSSHSQLYGTLDNSMKSDEIQNYAKGRTGARVFMAILLHAFKCRWVYFPSKNFKKELEK